MSEPYILTQTLGSVRSDFTGYLGFAFDTFSGSPPTVTDLARWKRAGNSAAHNCYLYKYVDGAGGDVQIATVSVDLSTGSDGTYVYAALGTPATLLPSTRYYVLSQETFGSDEWYEYDTTIDSVTAGIGTVFGPAYTPTLGEIYIPSEGDWSYIPTNFKADAGAAVSGSMWLG